MTTLIKSTLTAAAALLISFTSLHAETRVVGAGATFPKPLYLKWIAAYNEKIKDIKFDYTGGGSGAGQRALMDKTAQFAGSDAPLTAKQIESAPAKILHIPTVAGPVVITYNLPGVDKLTLDSGTLMGVYTGKISKWSDPAIAKLNAGVKFPDQDIVVTHRSDPSGTTNIFTTYLSSVSDLWKKVGASIDVKWPKGDGYKGNDGVADAVQKSPGGIGYVELAYAQEKKLPFASMINKDGKTVEANIDSVLAAADNVKDIPDDLILNITNAPGEKSYPIAGFTYILVYEDLKNGNLSKEQATALLAFLQWADGEDGQAMAAPNYARLPAAIRAKVAEKLKTLKFDNESLTK